MNESVRHEFLNMFCFVICGVDFRNGSGIQQYVYNYDIDSKVEGFVYFKQVHERSKEVLR
mgnify:CR=1 FL=1